MGDPHAMVSTLVPDYWETRLHCCWKDRNSILVTQWGTLERSGGWEKLSSPSTRSRNWIAVKGESGEECVFDGLGAFHVRT